MRKMDQTKNSEAAGVKSESLLKFQHRSEGALSPFAVKMTPSRHLTLCDVSSSALSLRKVLNLPRPPHPTPHSFLRSAPLSWETLHPWDGLGGGLGATSSSLRNSLVMNLANIRIRAGQEEFMVVLGG